MASSSNDLDFTIGVEAAQAQLKTLLDTYKKTTGSMGKETSDFEKILEHTFNTFGKLGDRAVQSQERYLKSLEKTAAVYGRSGVEKLTAQRDFEIRKLGQQKDAIDRVTAAYAKMIEVERGKGGGMGGAGGESFGQNPVYAFRAARDLFTGRTEFATVALGRLTYGLTGASVAATAGVAALAGLGVAAYSAAKSLGAYSDEMNNAALRTGLTVTQVDHFKFAAQTVGQDIGVFEGSMRQLTAAVEDFSGEGDKARGALVKLGVNVRDLSGEVRPTADILMDLSVAINAIPTAFERNKVGMDIFKRKWLEIAPSIAAVSTQVKYAKEQGWGPTDADIAKLGKYDDILDRMAHSLGEMARHMKTGLVDLFASIGDPRGVFNPLKYSGYTPQFNRDAGMNLLGRGDDRPRYIPNPLAGGSAVASRILDSAGSSRLEQMQAKASSLKTLVDESAAKLRSYSTTETYTDVAEKEGKIFQSRLSAYERQTAAIKSHNEALADTASITESLRKAEIDAADRMNRGAYFNLPANRELREFARHRGLSPSDPRVRRMDLITEPERQRQMAEGVEKLQSDLTAEVTRAVHEQEAAYLSAGQAKLRLIALETISASIQAKTNDEARKSEEKLSSTRIHTASILAADTPENRLQTEISLANVRQRSADKERENAEESINDAARRAELAAIARFPLLRQTGELDEVRQENAMNQEMALRLAKEKHEDELFQIGSDFDKKRAEEQRRQLDNIKQDVTSLLDTLFSRPSKFAAQLGSTIRGAVLRPISDSIGERVAQGMHPSIYGPTGTGGWSRQLRDMFGGGGGYPRQGVSSSGMTTDIGSGSGGSTSTLSPFIPYYQGGGYLDNYTGFAGIGMPDIGGIGSISRPGAPGGTPGFSGGYNIPGLSSGRTSGGMGGFDFSALKESFNIGKRGIPGVGGAPGTTTTSIADVLTSKGAASLMLAGGIPLAMAGITGSRRGTWGGVGMSTIGGALTGAGIGGMFGPLGMGIGAAIGTAAGFGIGLGEKLAGVESPQRQAKRLVRSQYGVSINDSMADAIVGIARQSYGNTVSIAVRSPQVREMIGLFGAGTGQPTSLSSSTPHGAGLVSSGGSLFSSPTYQYGNVYSAQSPFPSYNNGSGGTPTYISMHLDGKSAADMLTGQYVTPSYVANASAAAWRGSQGRMDAAMALSQPGSIVS